MHLGRFLHFCQKVVGVTLKTEVFSCNFQFTYGAKFVAVGQIFAFLPKTGSSDLKDRSFYHNFQFTYRGKFSAFG